MQYTLYNVSLYTIQCGTWQEKGRNKCVIYWPDKIGTYSGLTVTVRDSSQYEGFTVTSMFISDGTVRFSLSLSLSLCFSLSLSVSLSLSRFLSLPLCFSLSVSLSLPLCFSLSPSLPYPYFLCFSTARKCTDFVIFGCGRGRTKVFQKAPNLS